MPTEIEGSKEAILKTIKSLELNFKDKITDTYWGLWKDYSKKNNIKAENIVFKYSRKT